MKISQVFAVALLLAVGSVMAYADGIDPKIIVQGVGGAGPTHCPPSGCVGVGLNFSFSVPQGGTGTLFFTNNSGVNWTSLTLIEKGDEVPAADIKCKSYLFASCTTKTVNGNVEILLANGNGANKDSGIRAGQNFSISFSCVNKSCWPGGLSFTGQANKVVPEPGTIALMMTGLGALVSRRKKWKNRWNS